MIVHKIGVLPTRPSRPVGRKPIDMPAYGGTECTSVGPPTRLTAVRGIERWRGRCGLVLQRVPGCCCPAPNGNPGISDPDSILSHNGVRAGRDPPRPPAPALACKWSTWRAWETASLASLTAGCSSKCHQTQRRNKRQCGELPEQCHTRAIATGGGCATAASTSSAAASARSISSGVAGSAPREWDIVDSSCTRLLLNSSGGLRQGSKSVYQRQQARTSANTLGSGRLVCGHPTACGAKSCLHVIRHR